MSRWRDADRFGGSWVTLYSPAAVAYLFGQVTLATLERHGAVAKPGKRTRLYNRGNAGSNPAGPTPLFVRLRALANTFYWDCFWAGVGSDAHAFMEFNGLIGEYIKMLEAAAERGIDPRKINVHTGLTITLPDYYIRYFGEKLQCILSPFLIGNLRARQLLEHALFAESSGPDDHA